MRTRGTTVIVVGLLLLLSAACGGEAEEAASGNVLLYTSVPQPIMDELVAAFAEVEPEITLEVFRGTTGDVAARIATEQQAGAVQADLIWVAEPSTYESFKETDLLAPYSPPEDAPIPDEYVDPDGFYVAGRVINMIVAWNTEAHPDGLSDWPDLLDSEADAAFPPPSSGSVLAAVGGLTEEYGEDYFRTFAENGGVQVSANGAARDGLVSGEFGAAGVLDYMIREAKAEGSPVELAYPTSGTVVIPSPIALTSSASNPEAATVFLDFLMSQEGQEVVVDVGGFYPARTDVAAPEGAPALDEIPTINVDWQELAGRQAEIDEYWSSIFGG